MGYLRCRVSIDRSSHPHSFIRRAGCYNSLEFPGRCWLLLHTIRCAPCKAQSFVSVLGVKTLQGIHSWTLCRIGASAGMRPKKWTRVLSKSSDQNSSPYRVLRPHWQDLKANDLKQHCAFAYAVLRQLRIVAPENGIIRIWRRLKKTFYFRKSCANWGIMTITGPHMNREAIKMSSARNFRAINFFTQALGLKAPATESSSFQVLVPPLIGAKAELRPAMYRYDHALLITYGSNWAFGRYYTIFPS